MSSRLGVLVLFYVLHAGGVVFFFFAERLYSKLRCISSWIGCLCLVSVLHAMVCGVALSASRILVSLCVAMAASVRKKLFALKCVSSN